MSLTERSLYLAAYDIAHPRRLRQALAVVKPFATGGQKSMYECPLSNVERDVLLDQMKGLLEADEDAFILLRLDTRKRTIALGKASAPDCGSLVYCG